MRREGRPLHLYLSPRAPRREYTPLRHMYATFIYLNPHTTANGFGGYFITHTLVTTRTSNV